MHLLPHTKVHEAEEKPAAQKCTHCGRTLMERRGILHRLKPVSNAFVLHGHCLCHTSEAEKKAPAQQASCEFIGDVDVEKEEEKAKEVRGICTSRAGVGILTPFHF